MKNQEQEKIEKIKAPHATENKIQRFGKVTEQMGQFLALCHTNSRLTNTNDRTDWKKQKVQRWGLASWKTKIQLEKMSKCFVALAMVAMMIWKPKTIV